MNFELNYSKKEKRELSPFLAKELLFDYLVGTLDEDRAKAVEQVLKQSQELKSELEKVKQGLHFFKQFEGLAPDKEIIEQIIVPNSLSYKLLKILKFEEWPDSYRWALEAVLAGIVIFMIAVVVPWHRLISMTWNQSTQIVLSEYNKTAETMTAEKDISPPSTQVEVKNNVAVIQDNSENESPAPSNSQSADTPIAAVNVAPKVEQAAEPKSETDKLITPTTISRPKALQGFLFRGTATIPSIGNINSQLVAKLTEMGAQKAGQVDIGRLKGTTSYYHFSIAERELEEVKKLFFQYGSLDLRKEKHDRVMPEGTVRIIIEVSEEQAQNNTRKKDKVAPKNEATEGEANTNVDQLIPPDNAEPEPPSQ
jgi:hypothetical protein